MFELRLSCKQISSTHTPRNFQVFLWYFLFSNLFFTNRGNKISEKNEMENATGLSKVIQFCKSLGTQLKMWRAKFVYFSTPAQIFISRTSGLQQGAIFKFIHFVANTAACVILVTSCETEKLFFAVRRHTRPL